MADIAFVRTFFGIYSNHVRACGSPVSARGPELTRSFMAFEVLSLLEATVAYIAFSEDHDEALKSAMHHKVRDMIQVERREIRSKSHLLLLQNGLSRPDVPPLSFLIYTTTTLPCSNVARIHQR